MPLYDAFDDITEPRRQQTSPFFLRVARTRRARTVLLGFAIALLILLLTWGNSSVVREYGSSIGSC